MNPLTTDPGETTFATLDLPNLTGSLTPFGDFLLLVMIIAVLTMAFLQILKFLGLKRAMHKNLLHLWIQQASKHARVALKGDTPEDRDYLQYVEENITEKNIDFRRFHDDLDADQLLAHLTQLAFPSAAPRLFYQMPLEQLVGQINAAVQPLIDSPTPRDAALLFALSHEAGVASHLIAYGPHGYRDPKAIGYARAHHDTEIDPDVYQADAVNRTNASVQRSLDSLQIFIGARWRSTMAMTSSLIAIFSAFGFALLFDQTAVNDFSDPLTPTGAALWAVIALTATVLAPVLRDIAVGIQRLARPAA